MLKAALLLTLVCCPAAAAQELLDLTVPGAQVIIGLHIERIAASPLGKFVSAQVAAQAPEIGKLTQAVGFDPLRSVREVIISAPGKSQPQRGLVALRGSFTGVNLPSLLRAQGAAREILGGVEIFVADKPRQPMALALLDEATLIAGDPASVRGAVSRLGQPARLAPALQRLACELSSGMDIWFASTLPVSELAAGTSDAKAAGPLGSDAWKGIRQLSGGLRLGPSIDFSLTAETRSEQDATALAGAIRFFLGMARSRQSGPSPFTESLDIRGGRLRLTLTVAEQEVEKLILAARKSAPGSGRPAAATGVTVYSSEGVIRIPPPTPVQ